MITRENYSQTVDAMIRYCKQYYLYPDHGECEISDYQYDRLYRELADFEEAHPDIVRPDSPVDKVAGGVMETASNE